MLSIVLNISIFFLKKLIRAHVIWHRYCPGFSNEKVWCIEDCLAIASYGFKSTVGWAGGSLVLLADYRALQQNVQAGAVWGDPV